jgi:hypothetical protein
MKRQVILAVALAVTALALLAQNFTGKPLGVPTDQQRIEQLERQVSVLQMRLAALEQRTSLQFKPLENPK